MIRPHVRGDAFIPSWSNAACILHSPISGFSCFLRISLAISIVTTLGALRARDLSSRPLTPSLTHRFNVVYTVCREVAKYSAIEVIDQPSAWSFFSQVL